MTGLIFITHQTEKYSYAQSAEIALRGGCKHIQLRMKDAPFAEIKKTAVVVKKLCDQYGACFYIDDHVEICKNVGATGVHLGKTDMPPAEARKILDNDFIIGSTANTFDDIVNLHKVGVDYIGLGPFRFTETKKNLSPLLGLKRYTTILQQCRENKIDLPIFAIGGIAKRDIPELMKTGIAGVALSSTILRAKNPVEETKKLIKTIQKESKIWEFFGDFLFGGVVTDIW
ncbi:MAG: thiamine phosphate synthase [Bacteroidetes bacterium]|nr:thiamine phosphate synthase [Bacteroidota bacterium]